MAAPAFALGLDVFSSAPIKEPPSAKVSQKSPSIRELDAIELPDYGLTNKGDKNAAAHDGTTPPTPKTPNDLERSQPPTPRQSEAAGIMPTFWYPGMNKWRVLSACGEYFANGLNDSAPGALIPYIETWYDIGVGFILAAFMSDFISAKLGRAKGLMLSELVVISAYVVIACPIPFPVVVVAYCAIGFGEALEIALNNVFLANLANATVVFGAAQGFYGIGGMLGPIMATALVSNGVHWARFYAIAIIFRLINLFAVGWSFWNYEKEGMAQFSGSLEQIASQQSTAEYGDSSKRRMFAQALKKKTTIIGALFIFAYQGAEVAEAGWVITYLIEYVVARSASLGAFTLTTQQISEWRSEQSGLRYLWLLGMFVKHEMEGSYLPLRCSRLGSPSEDSF
ncbi:uncharacterized protein LTR77_009132 [Saxophila tyrrhenica]|uniref:Uncharacterized protein n=1 Tax=Saxophila tyrrhenica TaxID=1690608 RepID=A0AAV9P1N6_9PEZI|nr:hypothetical protein LTR77_009132 [Saxophila tyrrhenica]